MAYISHKHRFVFIHVPKTGGTSIVDALVKMEGGELALPRDYFAHEGIGDYFPSQFRPNGITTHDPWHTMVAKCPELQHYRRFAVIRNPWDRVYSYFQHKRRRRDMDLPRTAEAKIMQFRSVFRISHILLVQPQLWWLSDQHGHVIDNVELLNFEHLDTQFKSLMDRWGVPAPDLPRLNTNPTKVVDYREFYDDYSRQIVHSFYRAEIEQFEYEF